MWAPEKDIICWIVAPDASARNGPLVIVRFDEKTAVLKTAPPGRKEGAIARQAAE
jgi:hypothetical protein